MYKEKENKMDFYDIKNSVFKSPVTKIVLVGIGVLALIGISGYIFKVVNFSVRNYNQLRNTITSK